MRHLAPIRFPPSLSSYAIWQSGIIGANHDIPDLLMVLAIRLLLVSTVGSTCVDACSGCRGQGFAKYWIYLAALVNSTRKDAYAIKYWIYLASLINSIRKHATRAIIFKPQLDGVGYAFAFGCAQSYVRDTIAQGAGARDQHPSTPANAQDK
jgi:hypothetical protein